MDLEDLEALESEDLEALEESEDLEASAALSSARQLLGKRRRDIFTSVGRTHLTENMDTDGAAEEVVAAVDRVAEVASRIIRQPTRRSYTQVYNQICDYAATLNPPYTLNIVEESIPPAIIISYMCVMFTAANTPVVDGNGIAIHMNNGQPRLGKGFAESTFKKHYHALRTLHIHFQQETEPKRNLDGKYVGNSCNDSAVIVSL